MKKEKSSSKRSSSGSEASSADEAPLAGRGKTGASKGKTVAIQVADEYEFVTPNDGTD